MLALWKDASLCRFDCGKGNSPCRSRVYGSVCQSGGSGHTEITGVGHRVTVGVLEAECLALNRRFITFHTHHRPYITLKWAESADGFMDSLRTDYEKEKPYAFSTPYTRMLVHRCRAEHQAILVGRQTALADNPSLNLRMWPGKSPLRLVIDRRGDLPGHLALFNDGAETRVYLDVLSVLPPYGKQTGVTCVRLDFSRDILPQILDDLYRLSVQSLLVEGGHRLLESFISAGLWDEIRVEQSPVFLKEGVPSPSWPHGRIRTTEVEGHLLVHILSSRGSSAV